jgi:hypothetical protein
MKNKQSKVKPSSSRSKVPLETRAFTNKTYLPKQAGTFRMIRRSYQNNKLLWHTLLVLFVFFLYMIGLLVNRVMNTEEPVKPAMHFWEQGPINAERLQNQILLNAFGPNGADGFQSIRLSGHMGKDTEAQEFYLLKKAPNLAFLKMRFGRDQSVSIGVNADVVWRKLEVEGKPSTVEMIEGEAAEPYQALGNFFTPFMHQVVLRDSKIRSIELSDDLGFESIRIEYENMYKNCRSVVYLDIDDLSELEGVDYLPDNVVSRVQYSDYQSFDGVRVPMKSEYYEGDVLVQQIRLDKVTVNPGVLTQVFMTPQD